ncbi:hypothetical protein V498_04260, partial [Pseudogymnoascus sp. VKM F-4517 (FW-2822)]
QHKIIIVAHDNLVHEDLYGLDIRSVVQFVASPFVGARRDLLRAPNTEAHIAFLERQRNRNDGVLRIPGPRDADRGVAPEAIGEEAPRTPTSYRRASDFKNIRQGLDAPSKECEPQSSGAENGTPGHGNTIDGHPNRVATEPVEAAVQTLGNLKSRKSSMMNGDKYENATVMALLSKPPA